MSVGPIVGGIVGASIGTAIVAACAWAGYRLAARRRLEPLQVMMYVESSRGADRQTKGRRDTASAYRAKLDRPHFDGRRSPHPSSARARRHSLWVGPAPTQTTRIGQEEDDAVACTPSERERTARTIRAGRKRIWGCRGARARQCADGKVGIHSEHRRGTR